MGKRSSAIIGMPPKGKGRESKYKPNSPEGEPQGNAKSVDAEALIEEGDRLYAMTVEADRTGKVSRGARAKRRR